MPSLDTRSPRTLASLLGSRLRLVVEKRRLTVGRSHDPRYAMLEFEPMDFPEIRRRFPAAARA